MLDKSDLYQQFLLFFSILLTWFTGETGRIMVAGGAGGALRWLSNEKRNIRDGVFAVAGGSIIAYYFWPLVMGILVKYVGIDSGTNGVEAMSGCIAGIFGASGIRILVAVVEARAAKLAKGDTDEQA